MRRNFLILLLCVITPFLSFAQVSKLTGADSTRTKDSLRAANFFSLSSYPLIKDSKWSGVISVPDVQERPDSSMKYKLLMELLTWPSDPASKREINAGLAEIGRIINLHVAAGVPQKNIETVIVIHGGALNVLLRNEAYRRKFRTDNPNLGLLKQFSNLGIKLLACGQAMSYFNFDEKDMIPEIKVALSAKVEVSTYQLKGFVHYLIQDDK